MKFYFIFSFGFFVGTNNKIKNKNVWANFQRWILFLQGEFGQQRK